MDTAVRALRIRAQESGDQRGRRQQKDQNCAIELWMIVKIYSVKTTTTTFIHKSFIFDVYEFDNLWKAIKIFVLITAKQKVWNICLSMTRVDGPTGSHYRPWRREREIFLTEPKEIFTMSQWALSRHKFRPGLHYPGPPDNTSELTLLATIIFLSFQHPFVANKGNKKK